MSREPKSRTKTKTKRIKTKKDTYRPYVFPSPTAVVRDAYDGESLVPMAKVGDVQRDKNNVRFTRDLSFDANAECV